jgi:hypothetical protein
MTECHHQRHHLKHLWCAQPAIRPSTNLVECSTHMIIYSRCSTRN